MSEAFFRIETTTSNKRKHFAFFFGGGGGDLWEKNVWFQKKRRMVMIMVTGQAINKNQPLNGHFWGVKGIKLLDFKMM
jgi:hypothetical protein